MRPRVARTAIARSAPFLTGRAFEEGSVIGFNGTQAGVEELALRDDHNVNARGELGVTKYLSNQTFSAVSLHRAAKFLRCRDTQAANTTIPGQHEDRAVATVNANATVVDLLKFGPSANALSGAKFQQVVRSTLFAAD